MTLSTNNAAASSTADNLVAGSLPRWLPWVFLLVSLLTAGPLTTFALGSFNVAATVALGVVIYAAGMHVTSMVVEGTRKAVDRLSTHLVIAAFMVALIPLFSLVAQTLSLGLSRFDPTFFTWSMRNIVGEGGGAVHAIIGTLWVTGIASAISVPVGLLTAIYLAEYGRGRLSQAITFFVDVMTGIPSIVAGLFAYSLMVLLFGPGTINGLSGAIALSVLMIPIVVRSAEELLRLVPNELREASYALGVPKWRTIVTIVLPTSLSGIASGIILAIARIIGETAPLLVAAGFTASVNNNPAKNAMMTLPVFVYDSYANPGVLRDAYTARAWAGALTLIAIVMILNLIGRVIAYRFSPKTGR